MNVCECVRVDRQHLILSPVFWIVCWAPLTCCLYICVSTKVSWYKCMCVTLGIKMTLWSTWAASNSEKSNSSQLKGTLCTLRPAVLFILIIWIWVIQVVEVSAFPRNAIELRTSCKYWVGPPFAFRPTLFLCGIDSIRCWKYSSDILVQIHMIATHGYCISVGCIHQRNFVLNIEGGRGQDRSHNPPGNYTLAAPPGCKSTGPSHLKGPTALTSGDCGGQVSTVNPSSRNQFNMIWALSPSYLVLKVWTLNYSITSFYS